PFTPIGGRCLESRRRNIARSTTADRRTSPPLHDQRLQRAAPLPLPENDAVADDGFVSFQRRIRRARTIADSALSASRSGPTGTSLPIARDHDERRREPRELDAARVASLG